MIHLPLFQTIKGRGTVLALMDYPRIDGISGLRFVIILIELHGGLIRLSHLSATKH